MNKPKVLQLGAIKHAHTNWSRLSSIAEIVTPKAHNRAAFTAECASGAFDGVSAIYRHPSSALNTGDFDAELVAALPPSLKFICHNGAGYDQIDVSACSARGIRVSNTPSAIDDATADLAMFLVLGCLRNLPVSMANLRAGSWKGSPGQLPALGRDPQSKILGILGMGGIGRNVARKARAFDTKIRYYNQTRLDEAVEKELGAEYVPFDQLLAESDVLSLNIPLNPKTRHIISTPEFERMKDGIVVINTARRALIDEAALVAALEAGKVCSAGLDVYEKDSVVHQGLLDNSRTLLVPHMGTWTVETQAKMEEWATENVRAAIERGELLSIVPEQKGL